MNRRITVAFDFDGVLHKYRGGWQDGSVYDELNEDILLLMCELAQLRHCVFIMSTRSKRQIYHHLKSLFYNKSYSYPWVIRIRHKTFHQGFRVMPYREKFFKQNSRNEIGITNHKVPSDVLIDDRCIRYDGQSTVELKEEISEQLYTPLLKYQPQSE